MVAEDVRVDKVRLLDPRLSFVILVGEEAEEEPEEPGVVDTEHDPSHLDDGST